MEASQVGPLASGQRGEDRLDRGLATGEHPAGRAPALGGELKGDRTAVGADAALDQPRRREPVDEPDGPGMGEADNAPERIYRLPAGEPVQRGEGGRSRGPMRARGLRGLLDAPRDLERERSDSVHLMCMSHT